MRLVPFIIGLVSGYCLIQVIVHKLLDKTDEIDVRDDCPLYIEKDEDNIHCHYNY